MVGGGEDRVTLINLGPLRCLMPTGMEFMDITSLGVTYRYVFKIKQKFKQKR
jgi:hypothetical protein